MSWLLYGVLAKNAAVTVPEKLQKIDAESLSAIVQIGETELSLASETVLAYGEKIAFIHQQTAFIPMRYGSVLASQETVLAHLAEFAERYHERLKMLDNCDEFGIRLPLETLETEKSHAGGLHYLLARKRAYSLPEKVEQQATFVNETLAGLYRQVHASESFFNGQRTYLLSYLVPRSQLSRFQHQVSLLQNSLPANAIFSGPWTPYTFTSVL